ncbi:MAG TPA: helicase-related protein, partial [Granulicella sp.]|nr:helicase-related protein [Granulicella sp.]
LVFVNTRRLVEKIAFELSSRLGPEQVAAHHGSLSRDLRLDAEQRLKAGEISILVATASLELGIDIGDIDLVCQISTTRAVAVAMQRVGRAGHWRGAIPKGRFFATTRDDLLEQAALIRKMRAGELDRLEIPDEPIDVLMQQIVACCAAEPWEEDALFAVLRRAWSYRNLTRARFDEILTLLHTGIESSRGRYGAYLLRDGIHGHLHPRRGARMTAIANGGAIPDTALYSVLLQPENIQIATLDEHFAVDSSPGDVILLGNTSWRIQRVEAAGRVLVEDAHGAPPSLPFWEGEAPQRTAILSDGVGELREQISTLTPNLTPHNVTAGAGIRKNGAVAVGADAGAPRLASETWDQSHQELSAAIEWLKDACGLCTSGAHQLIAYIVTGRAVLGAVPSKTTIIAERFFDDGGGMQLILHAPFGGRLNKAWGLALRKRFCRGFNFELQAAATDNGINIALAEQHSFPLSDVFHFLSEHTAKELLEQAAIASPIFKNRWRWAAGRSLQLLRMSKGKRIAPQIQRTRSEDLLASVFPQAAACFETLVGDIQIPDHPLVDEVMKDVLHEAMDLEGLIELLRGIESGAIRCLAIDTPIPSVFAHELLNANPYAFLDEAGLEERRARAVNLRGSLPASVLEEPGKLDPAAIATVRRELWPDLRDEHELHDLLHSLILLPLRILDEEEQATSPEPGAPSTTPPGAPCLASETWESSEARRLSSTRHWPHFYQRLAATGRVQTLDCTGHPCWIATERLPHIAALCPLAPPSKNVILSEASCGLIARGAVEGPAVACSPAPSFSESQQATESVTKQSALNQCVQGWLQILGPTTAQALADRLHLDPASIYQAFLAMEMQGLLMRGAFEHPATNIDYEIEWCERRILQRIHRLTVATRRKQIEAVSPAVYLRWLLGWQHLAPQTQLTGEEGVLRALEQLEGFEAPAVEWERTLLPARVAHYDPRWLDALCLSGAVGWGRISPHPAWSVGDGSAPRRVIPTNAAPITFYVRESADWLPHALAQQCVEEPKLAAALTPEALQVRGLLQQRGACFANDLQRIANLTRPQIQQALWELATAGLAAADGFDQLRVMMDPKKKSSEKKTRSSAGRWSLLCEELHLASDAPPTPIERARRTDAALESFARMLLARYGVLFRDLLARESNAPKWRDLLGILRRLEARGEIRGGRFVTGFGGEQFALPEAAESLRAARHHSSEETLTVAAADPMNLAGIVVPGERVPSVPGKQVQYRNGAVLGEAASEGKSLTGSEAPVFASPTELPPPPPEPPTPRLFS